MSPAHSVAMRAQQELRERITRPHLHGFASLLVGLSQLLLAFVVGDNWQTLFVMGTAGWLLTFLGVGLLAGHDPTDIGGSGNELLSWALAVPVVVVAIAVVLAANTVAS